MLVEGGIEEYQCEASGCNEPAIAQCDSCDHFFCEEHGQRGGDRQVQDVGMVAYPSLCIVCKERA